MGYSIYTVAATPESREKMRRFVAENWPKYTDDNTGPAQAITTDLSYTGRQKNKLLLGFEYPSWVNGEVRHALHCCVRFMALRVGAKRQFAGLGKLPYWIYDGVEVIPISQTHDKYRCQPDGWKPYEPLGGIWEEHSLIPQIRSDFDKMTELWKSLS